MSVILKKDVDSKLARLRKYMQAENYDFYIVFTADPHLSEYISPVDKYREYLTGFTGSAGTLLVSRNEAFLWVDGRYFIQAENEVDKNYINIMKMGEKNVPTLIGFLTDRCKMCNSEIIVAFDGKYVSADFLQRISAMLPQNVKVDSKASINDTVWPDRPERKFSPVRIVSIENAGLSSQEKIKEIRNIVENNYNLKNQSYSFIISELCSIMWISNLRGSDILYVPVAFSYLIINERNVAIYLDDSVLSDDVCAYLESQGFIIKSYLKFYDDIEALKNITVLFDKTSNNSFIYNLVNNNNVVYVKESEIVRKDIKNETEVEHMRKYHLNDAASVIRFIIKLKKAVRESECSFSEYDAACLMDDLRLSDEACYSLSFDTISAYGENAALPHYSATEDNCAMLKPKGFFLVDCGGQYPSCTTDITRTIALGGLSEYEKKCYTAVLKGNLSLMKAVFLRGTRGENLDILAREPIWKIGIDFRHGTGHGIGCELSVHEGPLAIRSSINCERLSPVLVPGMVVSDEPGVYLENQFGIRLENELLVVEDEKNEWGDFLKFESLTLVPFEKEAILKDKLNDEELEYLNLYHEMVYEKVAPLLEDDEKQWLFENTRPLF